MAAFTAEYELEKPLPKWIKAIPNINEYVIIP